MNIVDSIKAPPRGLESRASGDVSRAILFFLFVWVLGVKFYPTNQENTNGMQSPTLLDVAYAVRVGKEHVAEQA